LSENERLRTNFNCTVTEHTRSLMVHVLGVPLPDSHLVRFALQNFYGIGPKISHRLCARLQIHDRCRIRHLTPHQMTALASFLSSPSTAPPLPRLPLAPPNFRPPPSGTPLAALEQPRTKTPVVVDTTRLSTKTNNKRDFLSNLKIESELRREMRENIAHQRMIGSYVGKRHAMGLPVRGQNTQNNAQTAKRLNRVERYA